MCRGFCFFLCGCFSCVVDDDYDDGGEYHCDADEESCGEAFVEDECADGNGGNRFERAHDGSRRRADESHGDGHSDERDECRHDAEHELKGESGWGSEELKRTAARVE